MQRRFRLRRSADIELLRRKGQRWHHPLVLLVTIANGEQVSRFGFSASRRVGKATKRNRSKRLLREALRRRVETIRPGWDCLFIARQATADADFVEVEMAVSQLLCRADIIMDAQEQEESGCV